uniref:Protein PET100 homolog, mitochondrial n=1 Tax=Catharus ustulatus TaxID=91951 RepID=A0A8C3UQH7_CATUS
MGVKLEILRMCVYLTFPVAMFWVSNQAEFFQRHVIDRKVGRGHLGDTWGHPGDTWGQPSRRALAELKQRLREGKGTQA